MRRDGSLWALGANRGSALGTGTDRQTSPAPVVGLTEVRTLASSFTQALAVRENGSVWQWGFKEGTNNIGAVPSKVRGIHHAVAAGAGSLHALALRQDGTVWAWGSNDRGQLGSGAIGERRDTPGQVAGLSGVVAVAAGDNHTLALKQDGTVWAWGANQYSQLGDLTLEDRPAPVQVQGLEGVAAVYACGDLSVALLQDGTVWQWGSDLYNWIGGDPLPPAQVPELSEVVKVSVLNYGFLALRADGTVWEWYLTPPDYSIPVQPVEGLTEAVDLTAAFYTTQILRADGTVWNIGSNISGGRGIPSAGAYSLELMQVPGLTGGVSLFSGSDTVHVLRTDGTLLGWGGNVYGTVGNGVSPIHLRPTRVPLP
jgi:alpha-tubulin suppressor-like RCC1 family protein